MSLIKMLGSVRLWQFVDFHGNHSSHCSFSGDISADLKSAIEVAANQKLGSDGGYNTDKTKRAEVDRKYAAVKKLIEEILNTCENIDAIERYEKTRTNEIKASIYEIYQKKEA